MYAETKGNAPTTFVITPDELIAKFHALATNPKWVEQRFERDVMEVLCDLRKGYPIDYQTTEAVKAEALRIYEAESVDATDERGWPLYSDYRREHGKKPARFRNSPEHMQRQAEHWRDRADDAIFRTSRNQCDVIDEITAQCGDDRGEKFKQQHAALAAKDALDQLAPRLKIKRAQVEALESRASEFFEPARLEAYRATGVEAVVERKSKALDEAREQADAIYHDIKAMLESDPRAIVRPVK
jgi:hypothetical protein